MIPDPLSIAKRRRACHGMSMEAKAVLSMAGVGLPFKELAAYPSRDIPMSLLQLHSAIECCFDNACRLQFLDEFSKQLFNESCVFIPVGFRPPTMIHEGMCL